MNNKKQIKRIVFLVVSAIIQAFALTNFFQSGGLLSGGLTGIALIVNKLSEGAVPLTTVLLGLNIPLAALGYFNVGKKFTILSFLNVGLTSLFLTFMPGDIIVLNDILLNAIVGGVIMGLGVSLALEAGASTGGTDFIALYLSVKRQSSAGKYMLMLNGVIVSVSALLFGAEIAVYTLISIYVSAHVIDSIHVRYQRVTLSIITSYGDLIIDKLVTNGVHGVTKLPAVGGYTEQKRDFLYTVVSTYEMTDIKEMIFEIDKHAFVNVTSSQQVMGNFEASKYD